MLNRREQALLRRKTDVRAEEAHIAKTVALARQAKRPRPRMGFFAFCLRQVGFCGWQTWLLQGALLLSAGLALRMIGVSNLRQLAAYTPFLLRLLAVLAVLTTLPTLYRSGRYRMLETEIATQAGYARLLLSRLLLVGLGDLLMLSGALAFTVLTTDIGLLSALYCVLPPYLTMLAALLTLLPRIPLRSLPYALAALSAVMLAATVACNALPLSAPEALPRWGGLCAALLLLCVLQLSRLRRRGGYADVQFSA